MGYGKWHDEWGASMMRERTGGFEKGPQNPFVSSWMHILINVKEPYLPCCGLCWETNLIQIALPIFIKKFLISPCLNFTVLLAYAILR
jgi:hypothetical protein